MEAELDKPDYRLDFSAAVSIDCHFCNRHGIAVVLAVHGLQSAVGTKLCEFPSCIDLVAFLVDALHGFVFFGSVAELSNRPWEPRSGSVSSTGSDGDGGGNRELVSVGGGSFCGGALGFAFLPILLSL